jgi:hypothetical protein
MLTGCEVFVVLSVAKDLKLRRLRSFAVYASQDDGIFSQALSEAKHLVRHTLVAQTVTIEHREPGCAHPPDPC